MPNDGCCLSSDAFSNKSLCCVWAAIPYSPTGSCLSVWKAPKWHLDLALPAGGNRTFPGKNPFLELASRRCCDVFWASSSRIYRYLLSSPWEQGPWFHFQHGSPQPFPRGGGLQGLALAGRAAQAWRTSPWELLVLTTLRISSDHYIGVGLGFEALFRISVFALDITGKGHYSGYRCKALLL